MKYMLETRCAAHSLHLSHDAHTPCPQIEEGEVDAERGRLFGACFRRMHKKEQDEIIRQQREERLAKKREGQVA